GDRRPAGRGCTAVRQARPADRGRLRRPARCLGGAARRGRRVLGGGPGPRLSSALQGARSPVLAGRHVRLEGLQRSRLRRRFGSRFPVHGTEGGRGGEGVLQGNNQKQALMAPPALTSPTLLSRRPPSRPHRERREKNREPILSLLPLPSFVLVFPPSPGVGGRE